MDKQVRPLDEYFEAARSEPGISEQEVRAIVAAGRTHGAWRRRLAVVTGAAAIVLAGALLLGPGAEDRPATRVAPTAAVAADRKTKEPIVIDDTSTTTNTTTQEEKMNRKTIMRGALATVAALGVTTTSNAQTSETPREVRREVRIERNRGDVKFGGEVSPEMERMATELGRDAARFWTDRLNGYKTRIDRMISPTDLEALNRMRVRFGVMVAEHTEVDGSLGTARVDDENVSSDGDGERKEVRKIEVRINGSDANAMEFLAIHQGAKEIAARYRGDFDQLAKDVLADAATFLRTMKEAGDRYAAQHRVELEKTEDGRTVAMGLSKGDEIIAALSDPETQAMIQMVYSMAVEPLVMLYDGTDLASFFSQGPLSSAVTGLNLAETSALKQNVPNPATGRTSIPYVLDEPSSATTLRLYDATGTLVGTYDQGAREAGEHAASIDVSSLPAGVYLYHLTVSTAGGERVHSKAMQIVK